MNKYHCVPVGNSKNFEGCGKTERDTSHIDFVPPKMGVL